MHAPFLGITKDACPFFGETAISSLWSRNGRPRRILLKVLRLLVTLLRSQAEALACLLLILTSTRLMMFRRTKLSASALSLAL
jgi:hypothetical protein